MSLLPSIHWTFPSPWFPSIHYLSSSDLPVGPQVLVSMIHFCWVLLVLKISWGSAPICVSPRSYRELLSYFRILLLSQSVFFTITRDALWSCFADDVTGKMIELLLLHISMAACQDTTSSSETGEVCYPHTYASYYFNVRVRENERVQGYCYRKCTFYTLYLAAIIILGGLLSHRSRLHLLLSLYLLLRQVSFFHLFIS